MEYSLLFRLNGRLSGLRLNVKEETMQLLCIPSTVDHSVYLEQIHLSLPSLTATFEAWHRSGSRGAMDTLNLREQRLGVATLSGASLRLLYEIASQFLDDLHSRVYWHEASQSAAETQALLPKNVLVQKTVSMEMSGMLLLWSCVGEQKVDLGQRRVVATSLGMPLRTAKNCSINPSTCSPEEEFAMMRGMVSPFLPPHRPNRLAAVVLVSWPLEWEYQGKEVSISLSLYESLVLPLSCFRAILCKYAERAYTPNVRWIELPSKEWNAA